MDQYPNQRNSESPSEERQYSRRRVIASWTLHAYTALGLPINLLSMWYLTQKQASYFFALNLLAVFVDSTDGVFARKLKVKEVIPHFDGAKLDDLIDYLTFTFLPVLSLLYLDLVPFTLWPLLGVVLMSSAYGFCQTSAKTEDAFVGFPSYWNIVVVHIYLLDPPLLLTAGALLFFSILTFIPIHFVYPTRCQMLMKTTLIGGALYAVALAYAVFAPPSDAQWWVARGSLIYGAYYFIISAVHHRRTQRALRVEG